MPTIVQGKDGKMRDAKPKPATAVFSKNAREQVRTQQALSVLGADVPNRARCRRMRRWWRRAFCLARPPFGLGYDPDALDMVVKERLTAQERAQQPKTLLDNPGPPTEEEKSISSDTTNINGKRDADYLTARIARDRPDILERMQAGEYSGGVFRSIQG